MKSIAAAIAGAKKYSYIFGGGVSLDGPFGHIYVSPEGDVLWVVEFEYEMGTVAHEGYRACYTNAHRLDGAKEWATRARAKKTS